MKDFRKRVLSGSLWNIGASVVRFGFTLTVNIVLARLLTPGDFGLVAMAMVMSGVVSVLGGLGLGSALIQRKDLEERHRSSVFWIVIAVSAVTGGITAASGPFVAWFYQEPQLVQLMPIVAIQFPIAALAYVPQAQLARELHFADIAKVNLIAIFVSGVVGVATAALGGGVWAIIIRALLVHFVALIVLAVIVRWRPRWTFEWSAIRELLKFSLSYYVNQLFVYAARNLDTILVGKFLGTHALGIYSRSYTLMTLPMQSATAAVLRVLFSAFSSIQDDSARIRRVYLQYSGAVALFVLPTMLGLTAVARPVVLAVLGPDWIELVPIVQIMAPSATWQGVTGIHRALYLAKGQTALQLRYTIIGRGCVLVGIVSGLPFGITGVATGFVVGSFINAVINVHVAGGLVGLTWGQLLSHHQGVLFAALGMAGVVVGVGYLPEVRALSEWAQLGVLVPVGALVYGTAIFVFKPQPYREVMALVERYRKKKPAKP